MSWSIFTTHRSPAGARSPRRRAHMHAAFAAVGCFVAVGAGSAALSAPAMAATTRCAPVSAHYNVPALYTQLNGEICWNGSQVWDPSPYGTTLSATIPSQYGSDVRVQATYINVVNTNSNDTGTEELSGEVIASETDSLLSWTDLPSVLVRLNIECAPSGYCTSQASLTPF